MGYHIEEQIEDRVVPAFKEFIKDKDSITYEKFTDCIKSIFQQDDGHSERLKRLFLEALFPEDETSRPGKVIEQIFNILHEDQLLKELQYQDGFDLIIEKFNVVKEDEVL
jgi:hypothetical protein